MTETAISCQYQEVYKFWRANICINRCRDVWRVEIRRKWSEPEIASAYLAMEANRLMQEHGINAYVTQENIMDAIKLSDTTQDLSTMRIFK